MSEFNVGDVVALKTGGPNMTVGSVHDSEPKVYCEWFAGDVLKHGCFNPVNLIVTGVSP